MWDNSLPAFNVFTAGTDKGEVMRRGGRGAQSGAGMGGGGGGPQPANTDNYFIPQCTESLRLVPRGGERTQGGKTAQSESKAKIRRGKS